MLTDHYPQQFTIRDGAVTVTLLDPYEGGFLHIRDDLLTPTAGDLAAEEGAEVLWRCGDEPTTVTLPDGTVAVAYATTQTARERAQDRVRTAAWTAAVAVLAAAGFTVSDEPYAHTDAGEQFEVSRSI